MKETSLKFSVATGLVVGLALLGMGYVYFSYAPPDVRANHIGAIRLAVMFVAGGLIGGVIFWLAQPLLARGHAGRGLVGFLSCAPLGVALGLSSVPGTMMTPEQRVIMGLVIAALFGGGMFMVDN